MIEDDYLSGRQLYGDDFGADDIAQWFNAEREGYADLVFDAASPTDDGPATYGYHALNWYHGFRHLPTGQLGSGLGVGSGFGHEFAPIVDRLDSLSIVESSQQLRARRVGALAPRYYDPSPTGELPFPSESFDLVTCLSVLHHIPNVSAVLADLARVTRRGGWVLLREPIVSMGDWRRPRPGLTARERGIPLALFRDAIGKSGMRVERESLCVFSLTTRIPPLFRLSPFGSRGIVRADSAIASATKRLYRYHATNTWQKLRPTAVFYVLRR